MSKVTQGVKYPGRNDRRAVPVAPNCQVGYRGNVKLKILLRINWEKTKRIDFAKKVVFTFMLLFHGVL